MRSISELNVLLNFVTRNSRITNSGLDPLTSAQESESVMLGAIPNCSEREGSSSCDDNVARSRLPPWSRGTEISHRILGTIIVVIGYAYDLLYDLLVEMMNSLYRLMQ